MPYTSKTAIKAYISGNDITAFLDDDRDGTEDAGLFDAIVDSCSVDADGYLASIYSVPFGDPVPAKVRAATTIFVCEALYARRLTPDEKNPFKDRADMWRAILEKVGEGLAPLDAEETRGFAPGAALLIPLAFNETTL